MQVSASAWTMLKVLLGCFMTPNSVTNFCQVGRTKFAQLHQVGMQIVVLRSICSQLWSQLCAQLHLSTSHASKIGKSLHPKGLQAQIIPTWSQPCVFCSSRCFTVELANFRFNFVEVGPQVWIKVGTKVGLLWNPLLFEFWLARRWPIVLGFIVAASSL